MLQKRWYRSKRSIACIFFTFLLCLSYLCLKYESRREYSSDMTKRYMHRRMQESLKQNKGTGCEIPVLDPFAKEVTQFDKEMPKVVCQGTDWVKCHYSECRVVNPIFKTMKNIVCAYSDILYQSDLKYTVAEPVHLRGDEVYTLIKSDHVKILCTGTGENNTLPSIWEGYSTGFRSTISPKTPPGRERSLSVLILGFDSTSRNGFIRRMPKSYRVLTEVLNATVFKGYNIVGDGTPAALFPLLTGKTEFELPDLRKFKYNGFIDSMPFIFYKLRDDGYRTAYFEDMPWIGTFQYRFNGFQRQPADHYLRAFYLEESNNGKKWLNGSQEKYCVGDTPRYKLMLNITDQFLNLNGKRFCFTFIADITHDDFNVISTADDDVTEFLLNFKESGRTEETLLVVMGDHGPRFAKVRDTAQGKLEEQLPLMAILLPEALKKSRPQVQNILESNAEVLTTPHDIHATLLDVMGLRKYWNPYRIIGADIDRGLTLLEEVPKNRSCSEAGVEPHWCSCLSWKSVAVTDPLYDRTAKALVEYINSLTESVRSKCVPRILTSIEWVKHLIPNSKIQSFMGSKDKDYVGTLDDAIQLDIEIYEVKIVVGPGRGVYEASLTYYVNENEFRFDTRDISRINPYNKEPSCIKETHPHLTMYCYCNIQI